MVASAATSVTESTAVLTGTFKPNGADTTVSIQYGTIPGYGNQSMPVDIGSGFGSVVLSSTLSSLSPLTTYYYQVVAINSNGTSYGQAGTFNTNGPVALNSYVALTGSSIISIQPLANDTDPNGFPLTITSISHPSLGSAVLSPDGTTITYTPNQSFSNFAGSDTFTYTISNGEGGTATAEVIIGNPFYLQKGNFAGTLNNPGGGYLTLTTTANGLFTGKLRIGRTAYSLKGTFAADGSYSITLDGLPLTLQFDIADMVGKAFGQYQIAGSYNGVNFTTYHALYNSTTDPAPEAGTYTVLLPAASGNNPLIPSGTGYATLNVNETGNVSISGMLPDGTAFSDGVYITGGTDSYGDSFPFYTALPYKVLGSLIGSMTFEDIPAVDDTGGTDCDGALTWVKPAQTNTGFYPGGFATTLTAEGSWYVQPPYGTLALNVGSSLPNASIALTEPDFSAPITHHLSINLGANASTDNVSVTDSSTDALALSISASGGSFTGSFIHPVTRKKVTFKGLILYKQTRASGYFVSPTQSGAVTISHP